MNIRVYLLKRKDEQIEIVRAVRLKSQGVSVKVMAKSSTMLAPIASVDSRMWRQELPVAMQIVFANLQGLKWP